MAFGFKRIVDLSALSLKQLNDQIEQLWLKLMGGIGTKDLDGQLKNVIDSKVSSDKFTSLLQQNQSQIKLMVGSVGNGDNAVYNGNGNFGTENWVVSGNCQAASGGGYTFNNGEIIQYNIKAEPGKAYTLGFSKLGGKLQASLRYYTAGQGPPTYGTNIIGSSMGVDSQWCDYAWNVTIPANAASLLLQITCSESAHVKGIYLRRGVDIKMFAQNPNEIYGSGIRISKDVVEIATPRFRLDLLNDNYEVMNTISADKNGFDKLVCQNLTLRGRDLFGERTKTIYVNASTGNDASDGATAATAYRTINKALKGLPLSHYEASIYLAGGSYYEDLVFDMGSSGMLHIYGEGAMLYGSIEVANGSLILHMNRVSVYSTKGFAIKSTAPGSLVTLDSCLLDCGRVAGSSCANFAYGSRGIFTTCQMNNAIYAVNFSYLAMGGLYGCSGKNNNYSLYTTNSGYLLVDGTVPYASVMLTEATGGTVFGDFIASQNTTGYVTPANLLTLRYNPTAISTKENTVWKSGVLKQGYEVDEAGNGVTYGAYTLFAKTTIKANLSLKTIHACKLVVKRKSTDPAEEKQLELWGHSSTALYGSPALVKSYGVVANLKPGEEAIIALPTTAVTDFTTGSVYGFCFTTTSQDSSFRVDLDESFVPYFEVQYR